MPDPVLLCSKTAHTPGNGALAAAHTQLIASTAAEYDAIRLTFRADALRGFFNIYTGAAASEVLKWEGQYFAGGAHYEVEIPIRIPVGTRITIRAQASAAGTSMLITAYGIVGVQSWARADVYGLDTVNTAGTVVDAGGSINTDGVESQLTAATAVDTDRLRVTLGPPNTSPAAGVNLMAHIGKGATVMTNIISNLYWRNSNGLRENAYLGMDFPVTSIPAGTRLAARCQSDNADANGRTVQVVVHALSSPYSDSDTIVVRKGESMYNRKYGVTLAGAKKIRRQIMKADGSGFATDSDWTPANGDVKVSKDAGATANIGTLPAYTNGAWEFILSDVELTAEQVNVSIVDAAVMSDEFTVETFGHASAMYPDDVTSTDPPEVDLVSVLGNPLSEGGDAPASPIGYT